MLVSLKADITLARERLPIFIRDLVNDIEKELSAILGKIKTRVVGLETIAANELHNSMEQLHTLAVSVFDEIKTNINDAVKDLTAAMERVSKSVKSSLELGISELKSSASKVISKIKVAVISIIRSVEEHLKTLVRDAENATRSVVSSVEAKVSSIIADLEEVGEDIEETAEMTFKTIDRSAISAAKVVGTDSTKLLSDLPLEETAKYSLILLALFVFAGIVIIVIAVLLMGWIYDVIKRTEVDRRIMLGRT
jgi:hypothetical protein